MHFETFQKLLKVFRIVKNIHSKEFVPDDTSLTPLVNARCYALLLCYASCCGFVAGFARVTILTLSPLVLVTLRKLYFYFLSQ